MKLSFEDLSYTILNGCSHEGFVVGADFLYVDVILGVDVWFHGAVCAQHRYYSSNVLKSTEKYYSDTTNILRFKISTIV